MPAFVWSILVTRLLFANFSADHRIRSRACTTIVLPITICQVNAVFAADSVARLSGQLGVAVVTSGPGVTNTITAVKNAQMAQSPMLILGGAAATVLKVMSYLQYNVN